ncbi:MAG: creatininase family protein [Chloroflexota bacterium]
MSGGAAGKLLWAEMRRPELEEAVRQRAVVLVPVGSIEQHGRHLPVDTDTNSVDEICRRAAALLAEPRALVVPALAYGLSPHHMGFTGTLTLRFDTLVNMVCDVCRSIHAHGFRKIVLVNGHGGNAGLITGVTSRLVEERIFVASLNYWAPITAELREIAVGPLGTMSHACEMETSVQLYLRPELVDMPAAVKAPVEPLTSFFFKDFRAPGSVNYTLDFALDATDGVRGDPTIATAETGERIVTAAVSRLAQFLKEFAALPER